MGDGVNWHNNASSRSRCQNLRLPYFFLISELNNCPILMFEYSFRSLGPPLQESEFLGNPVVSQETAVGKTLQNADFDNFGTFFASYRPPSGNLSSDSCRGGHKLRNEWSYIKIG